MLYEITTHTEKELRKMSPRELAAVAVDVLDDGTIGNQKCDTSTIDTECEYGGGEEWFWVSPTKKDLKRGSSYNVKIVQTDEGCVFA